MFKADNAQDVFDLYEYATENCGVSPVCPSCGHDGWLINAADDIGGNKLLGLALPALQYDEDKDTFDKNTSYHIGYFAVDCYRCGYARFHSVQTLLELVNGEKEEEDNNE